MQINILCKKFVKSTHLFSLKFLSVFSLKLTQTLARRPNIFYNAFSLAFHRKVNFKHS